MRLLRQIFQEQRVHRALQADMEFRDFALCEGDDPHAGVGRFFEETGNMFLVPADPVQSLGNNDIDAGTASKSAIKPGRCEVAPLTA